MKPKTLIAAVTGLLVAVPVNARVVPAWTASQQRTWGNNFLFPTNIPADLKNRTLRQVVRLGIGGNDVRVVLSNTYGSKAVNVAAGHVAASAGASRIEGSSDRMLRFGGQAAVTIAPGATVVSDPVTMSAKAGQDLAISLYFAEAPQIASFHWDGKRTGYVLDGDRLASPVSAIVETTTARLLLAGVLVDNPNAKGTVAVLGDSITDGAGATLDAEKRWPDYLAARAAPRGIAVVNTGISGARLLTDGMGSSALARFDRDVLAQPEIRTLILMLGINDIAWPGSPFAWQEQPAKFDDIIAGYRAVVARAHASNVRVIGTTITPFANAMPGTPLGPTFYTPEKDVLRRRVNDWIRTSNVFDALVDFDRLLEDPHAPGHLNPRYDDGDHLHPGDAGNKAMADAVSLETLIEK